MQNLADLVRMKNQDAKIYEDDDCVIGLCSKATNKELIARRKAFGEAIDKLKHL